MTSHSIYALSWNTYEWCISWSHTSQYFIRLQYHYFSFIKDSITFTPAFTCSTRILHATNRKYTAAAETTKTEWWSISCNSKDSKKEWCAPFQNTDVGHPLKSIDELMGNKFVVLNKVNSFIPFPNRSEGNSPHISTRSLLCKSLAMFRISFQTSDLPLGPLRKKVWVRVPGCFFLSPSASGVFIFSFYLLQIKCIMRFEWKNKIGELLTITICGIMAFEFPQPIQENKRTHGKQYGRSKDPGVRITGSGLVSPIPILLHCE